ncbi:MAG TPA: cupin domain-containing protein [Acetobacteraceae bacterium]|nr:cupin domain-containing protein [Acetobacteraceae bacterium]
MTTFRTGETPPAWCELTGFEPLELGRDQAVTRTPETARERLIGTAGTVQVRQGGRSMLLKPAQFLDIEPGAGPYTVVGHSDPAGVVRLCGHWGEELGGCGLFAVTRTDAPETKGDPVSYPKHTAIDSHYHDCDEYWIVLQGSGEAVVGGRHDRLQPGDCLCIGMGHHHDFPLIDSEVKAVFFETTLEGRKRTGHLWEHTHGKATPQPERV